MNGHRWDIWNLLTSELPVGLPAPTEPYLSVPDLPYYLYTYNLYSTPRLRNWNRPTGPG